MASCSISAAPAAAGHKFYPRTRCAHCGAARLDWLASARKGSVATFTVVHRAPSAGFRAEVPYVLALVDLDEQFRMMVNVRTPAPEAVRIGQRVEIVFERQPGGIALPQAVLSA